MNIIENLYFILWVAGFVAFLIFFFHEHYKYKKFVDKLKPGVTLQVTNILSMMNSTLDILSPLPSFRTV